MGRDDGTLARARWSHPAAAAGRCRDPTHADGRADQDRGLHGQGVARARPQDAWLAGARALRDQEHVHHARHRRWRSPEIIGDRITHTKIRRDAFSGYDRGPHWIETCGEIIKLKITPQDNVIALPIAVGGGASGRNDSGGRNDLRPTFVQSTKNRTKSAPTVVEAAGVEPASGNASELASTCVGTPFEVSRPPAAAGLRARRAS